MPLIRERQPMAATSPLYLHYYSIAYSMVITAYVFGFGEYIFFRLSWMINSKKTPYYAWCDKRAREVVGKNFIHYIVVIIGFIAIAFFQITCFFGLTISENWIHCTKKSRIDRMIRVRRALSSKIRTVMQKTIYPTFVCYMMSSMVIWAVIFYVDGIRDSIDELASTICIYIFDFIMVVYFLAFPAVTYIYHPYVRKRTSSPPIYANPGDNSVSLMNDNEIHCGGSPVGSVPNIAMELIACGWKNFQSEDYPPSTFSPPNVSGQRFIRNIKLTVTL
ncbi:unnamed protein product [Dracunculus medinensis]|uniref:G_PROTEIN_RECEP_F1_2 domain-containing protein n=1 Tax=Dracunculus medinensis TaxID=318479 RepID=A0A0N4U2P5_DRAME|nr:unnamed protein product [Dracunculus medinensis]